VKMWMDSSGSKQSPLPGHCIIGSKHLELIKPRILAFGGMIVIPSRSSMFLTVT
jgi:hypothetical protein